MTRVLLTGGSGQLGTELQRLRNYVAPPHSTMDILDAEQVAATLATVQPEVIMHAAAYTNTLLPDTSPEEAAHCWRTNVLGTRHLVQAAKCPIVFISTESAAHPYNFYVLTKVAAELEVSRYQYGYTILRTAFRCDPFEYPKACVDMWTLADTVTAIAPLLDAWIDQASIDRIAYVGTGPKTMYDLAKRTRPDVLPVTRADVDARLPAMTELCHVS